MPEFTKKLAHRRGQHTIEYAIIMTLVMAGIIIMGPYVIRSWNANMKGWEDTVLDSYDDTFVGARTIVLPGCVCNIVPGDPNFDCGPRGGCAEIEVFNQCVCNIVGCGLDGSAGCQEGTGSCVCDALCCTTPFPAGACGPAGGCPDGEMPMTFTCGCDPTPQTVCMPDPLCVYTCIPPINAPVNSRPCPGYEVNMTADINIVLVDSCIIAPAEAHCMIECIPPYFPNSAHTQCGNCPAGTVMQGPCPAGTPAGTYNCDRTLSCPSGQCPTI